MALRLAGVRELPLVRAALKARFTRDFPTQRCIGSLSGDYGSFDAAKANAPTSMPLGYDLESAADLYPERMARVLLKDYPALLWLSRVMPATGRLFDIGGHVGLMYYTYQRYLAFRDDFTWTVCDVPSTVAAGARLARERGESRLKFTTELDDVAGSDVVLATGSLQYIERPISDLLASMSVLPGHVLINETPTHASREIITLQNIGVAICPYRIARHGALVTSMTSLGYELVDSWDDPVRRTQIPYVTRAGEITYSGFYFRRP
jgi:putative methyltransferase (TIGR04325 family)